MRDDYKEMRKSAPPLLAIFRTQLQGELLALVYLRPRDAAVTISDLARELDAPVATVHREVTRLVNAGLLNERKMGRSRVITSTDDALISRPLTELLAVTFGPLPVLVDLLAGVEGVEHAYIYGSWAARYSGEPGPAPNDVDVLVVGKADRDLLADVAEEAGGRLRREVNIRRISAEQWRNDDESDPFLTSVRTRPLVSLTQDKEAVGQ